MVIALWMQCISSGHRVSRQMASEQCKPWHHMSRCSCQDTTRPDTDIKVQHVQTQLIRHKASGCSCRGIYLPDEECHGNCTMDTACVFQTQGVKADHLRMTYARAPRIQMQL